MDDLVRQAMAKWPNVPDCYGWLGLDSRGQWHMRDDRAQACGDFDSGRPGSKGALLRHDKLIEFIQRNYEPDAGGRWYFQNGPQRVYVELERTPWIWRIEPDGRIQSHTGRNAVPRQAVVDENGRLYLDTDQGFGMVHTQDVVRAAELLEGRAWPLMEALAQDLPTRYAYVPSPKRDRPTAATGP